tara:strand:+ start:614 stop:1615 length:1002 start_codon:yes stop_codon:yes gene_type:complete
MIFIRVDGANIEGIGTGHLYRMMFLADRIYKKTNISPMFVISGYQETIDILKRNNLKYIEINNKYEKREILKLSSSFRKDILIIDMMDRDENLIKKLVEKYIVISFDDTEGGAKYSDIIFNSLASKPLDRENYFYGHEYFFIRQEIAKYNKKHKKINSSVKNLLISLGASDPCSVNLMMIEWLKDLDYSGKIKWVLGSAVKEKNLIIERIKKLNLDIMPIIDYKDMGKLYYHADLCVCAAGFSLYEIACVGLPAVSISVYLHQTKNVRRFEENGSIYNLGYLKEIKESDVKNALYRLLCDQSQRSSMSKKGKTYVDGLGVERVMGKINQLTHL